MKIFNWCFKQEDKVLSYLERKEYMLEFLKELVEDTETEIDDIFYSYVKQKLEKNIKKK